jgi:hypothetical protein
MIQRDYPSRPVDTIPRHKSRKAYLELTVVRKARIVIVRPGVQSRRGCLGLGGFCFCKRGLGLMAEWK